MNKEKKESYNAIKCHIEQAIQDGIQLIRDFLSHDEEILVKTIKESKYNSNIHNVIITTNSEAKPLSFITLFEMDEKSAFNICDQVRALLISMGFEVINSDGSPWKVPEILSEHVSKLFNFIRLYSYIKIFPEYSKENAQWKIMLNSTDDSVVVIDSMKNISERSVLVIEHQLALLIAASDKTVETSDGVQLNIYGCVVSPTDV